MTNSQITDFSTRKRRVRSIKTITWKFRDIQESYPELIDKRNQIKSPKEFFDIFHVLFDGEVRELFMVFWLSSSNRVIGYETISIGSLNSSIAHAREIFRGAIVATAASLIVAHNHPSGNPNPSTEDIQITKKLVESGKLLDIPVFDHIIFAGNQYTSFVERRLI